MKQTAITAFSLAYAVGAAKHQQDRTQARNEAHRRHGRRALGVSRRQHRILIHALRTGE